MADQEFKQTPKAYGSLVYESLCSFTTAGTGQPTVGYMRGITAISRTGVGVFQITLAHTAKYYNVQVSQGGAVAVHLGSAVVSARSTTSRTVTITVCENDATPVAVETTGMVLDVVIRELQQ